MSDKEKDPKQPNPHKSEDAPPSRPAGGPVTTADEGEGGIPQGSGGNPPDDQGENEGGS